MFLHFEDVEVLENVHLKGINLKCNTEKTKTMTIGNESLTHNIKIEKQDTEQVGMFNYLESSTVKAPQKMKLTREQPEPEKYIMQLKHRSKQSINPTGSNGRSGQLSCKANIYTFYESKTKDRNKIPKRNKK